MFSCYLSAASIRSFGQILLPQYLMNSLSNLDERYREYSLAPTDDLIRFWRSKVKVHSRLLRWPRHPRRRCGVEVHFLVLRMHLRFLKDSFCVILTLHELFDWQA